MFSVSLPEFPSHPNSSKILCFSFMFFQHLSFLSHFCTKSLTCDSGTLYTNFHNLSLLSSFFLFSFAQSRFLFSLFKNAVLIPLNSSLPSLCQGAVSPSKFAQQSCSCTAALISTDSPSLCDFCPAQTPLTALPPSPAAWKYIPCSSHSLMEELCLCVYEFTLCFLSLLPKCMEYL